MKIAISASGKTLEAMVDPRFGRCQYFVYVDPETSQFEVAENPGAMAGGGAGIATAQAIAGKGVEVVLTGNCGPNAYQVLSAAGIKVITGVSGTIKEAIQNYKTGTYQTSSQANVPDHYGSTGGMNTGSGMGAGRGMGMGRGMRGMGAGPTLPANPSPEQTDQTREIDSLKSQSQGMAQQLNDMNIRIGKLENKQS